MIFVLGKKAVSSSGKQDILEAIKLAMEGKDIQPSSTAQTAADSLNNIDNTREKIASKTKGKSKAKKEEEESDLESQKIRKQN